jgi:tetraacyldisaccharide 4'-kinase
MRRSVVKTWKGEAGRTKWVLHPLLKALSLVYGVALKLRDKLYRAGLVKVKEVPIPVISVGNITLGGTGKTPIVERISRRLKEAGFNPGIVTRGYKRTRKGVFHVDSQCDDAVSVGDEAYMLACKTQIPVLVGADRAAAILKGIEDFQIDVAVLDDGFQLKNLRKDMEIVVLNGRKSRESKGLFPLGPFREPVARVREADTILISKGDLDRDLAKMVQGIPSFRVRYQPVHLYNVKNRLIGHYNFLKGKRVLAFSGLGDNNSFFSLLRELGARIVHRIEYPDHYAYGERDVERFFSHKDVEMIVTTEKDAVKLAGLDCPNHLFYLSIEARIEKEKELLDLIQHRVNQYQTHRA